MTSRAERIAELRGWKRREKGFAGWNIPKTEAPAMLNVLDAERWELGDCYVAYDETGSGWDLVDRWDPENDPALAFVLLGELAGDARPLVQRHGAGWVVFLPGLDGPDKTLRDVWFEREKLSIAICDAWIAMKEAESV